MPPTWPKKYLHGCISAHRIFLLRLPPLGVLQEVLSCLYSARAPSAFRRGPVLCPQEVLPGQAARRFPLMEPSCQHFRTPSCCFVRTPLVRHPVLRCSDPALGQALGFDRLLFWDLAVEIYGRSRQGRRAAPVHVCTAQSSNPSSAARSAHSSAFSSPAFAKSWPPTRVAASSVRGACSRTTYAHCRARVPKCHPQPPAASQRLIPSRPLLLPGRLWVGRLPGTRDAIVCSAAGRSLAWAPIP